jgi:putative ABC transport system permease protein
MGLVRLTVKNAGRAPVRGGLTIIAVAITLLAFVLLRTLSAGWTDRVKQTPNDRIIIRHQIGMASTLPVRYLDVVRQLPGVKRALGAAWVGFQLPDQPGVFFQSVAINPQDFVDMHYELVAPAQQKEAFVQNRHGALVGAELASERGWKVGDTLHFTTPDLPGLWPLTLSGIVTSSRVGFGQRALWMHYQYFNEKVLPIDKDRVSMIVAQLDNPADSANMAKAIDIHFDTEDDPTFTQDDKALNTAIVGRFGAMLGAINLISLLVLGVVVLILGNTIAMSTRERTREYGTLRALGFTPLHLASFVLGEAATIGLVGGAAGLLLAYPLVQGPFSRYLEEEMRVAPLRIAPGDALGALALGVLLGLVAAGLPALRAAKLEVTASLSHVA